MDVLLAVVTLAAVVYFVGWEDYLEPWITPYLQKSVKHLPTNAAAQPRSRRSRIPNVTNVRSRRQNTKIDAPNVPTNVPRSPAEAPPPGAFLISANELQQLANAISARANGATIEEAILRGFGEKKGSAAGYKRAKELFDAATKAP